MKNNKVKTIMSILLSAAFAASMYAAGVTSDTVYENRTGGNGAGLGGNLDGTSTAENVIFRNNESTGSGATLYYHSNGAAIYLISSTFEGNYTTSGNGGAIRIRWSNAGGSALFDGTGIMFLSNTANGGTGGAIVMSDNASTVILRSSTFSKNTAGNNGGAVSAAQGGSVFTGTNLYFSENTAGGDGGAIHNNIGNSDVSGTFSLYDAYFVSNTANNGGGIYTQGAAPVTLRHVTFEGNIAGNGGGIYARTSGVTIDSGTFKGNSATSGGAIYVATNGTITVRSGYFGGNVSSSGGGGAVFGSNNAAIYMENVVFTSNTSTGDRGGAVYVRSNATGTFNNVSFEGNTAQMGGGGVFVATDGYVNISSGTFKGNTTANIGGGISAASGNATLTNVVFISNTAADRGGAAFVGGDRALDINVGADMNIEYLNNAAGSGGFVYIDGGEANGGILNINIGANSTLRIGAAGAADANLDAIASDSIGGQLNKTGSGTLVLNADSSAFRGTLAATGGATLLGNANAQLGGFVTVSSAAVFGGLGAANNVSLEDDSRLLIGLDHGVGASTASDFTIGGTLTFTGTGARLLYDLISDGVNDHLVAGDIVFGTGTSTIDLNTTTAGTYTLITLTTGIFAASATSAFETTKNGEALSERISKIYSLANSDTELVLTLDKSNYLRRWAGANSDWNGTSENWAGDDDVDNLFLDGDKVVFNDSASIKTINLAGGMTAAEMLVETAETYTFTGAAIETNASSVGTTDATFGDPATGKLTKKGTGTLILDNAANNFTGGIALDSGTLQGSTASFGSALVTGSDNTAIVLNQADAGVYTGTLAGNATFAKTGNATMTLSTVDQLLNTASVNIAAGTLDTNSLSQTLKNLTGSGTLATGPSASTVTLNAITTSTFAGVITGAGNIDKTGAATLVLAGDSIHDGTTTITSGTLQLGAGAAAGSVRGTIINNSALAADHGAFSSTLAATLSGAGTFTKLGTGALSLTADSSGYAGPTQISAGALLLGDSASKLGGAITVNATGALGGIGSATGNVSVATGGAIIAGNTHNNAGILVPGTFNIAGTLTLANNAILKYDLFADGQSDLITVNNLSLAGAGIIDVSSVGTGTYTLMTLTGGATFGASNTSAFSTIQNGNQLSGRTSDNYSLSDDSKSLLLTIETANLSIIWAGTTSNLWVANVDNWDSDDNQFVGADKVTFGATTSGTIDIDSNGVLVSDMIVNSPGEYTFTGGVIATTTVATGLSGTGKLIKDGAGTLIFRNSAATFIGGIDILQGKLEGSTDTLNVGATGTVTNNATLVFNQETDATYSNPIVGTGSLAKTGTGALILDNAANTYAGGISVDDGSLTILNSGTSTRSAIDIDAGASLNINGGAAYTLAHGLTGSGTLAIDLNDSNSLVQLTASTGNAYAGTLVLGKSAYTLSGNALANAALRLGTGNITTVSTGTHALGSLVIDGATMIFSATAPADKTAQSYITVTDLDISNNGIIQVGVPADIPAVLPDTSLSILEQDDIADGIRLIGATGAVTGDGANLMVADQTGMAVDITLARTIAINKSPTDTTKVADAEYQYKLGTNDARDGLYFGYALNKLTISDGQVLELVSAAGASEAASTLSAIVEGSGGLLLNGAAGHNGTLTLGGNNSYAGPTQVTGGTVRAGSDNAFGVTSSLDIASGAAVDLNNKAQSIGTLANQGALALGTGTLNVRSGGSSTGVLTGAAGSRINFETGSIAIAGANPDLHAAMLLGSGAAVAADDAQALGDGAITFDAGSTLAIANGGTLANTLASSISNAGTLVKGGAGTLTVIASNTAFSGRIEVEEGSVEIVGNASLGTATFDLTRAANARIIYNGVAKGNLGANINGRGTLVLTNGARMTMDRDLAAFALELRNSTIGIAHTPNDDETFNTFHVASLVGTGTINMSVNFGRAKHDQLIIDDTAGAGADDHFSIVVTPVSSRRASAGTLIPLIVGAEPSARFELVDGSVTSDNVNIFTLWQGGQNQNISDPGTWYLAASPQLTKVADAIINTTSMMGADWNYELESLNKRMGDVRSGIFAENAPSGGNIWLAGNGYRINASSLNAGGYEFEQTVYGATLGADKMFRAGKSAILLGLFAGMTSIDRDFTEYGDGKSDVVNGGVYLTWMHRGGFYADIAAKLNSYKNSFSTRLTDGDAVKGDYTTASYGASVEMGYRISAASGWWCEPAMQFSYSKLQGADYTTDSDLAVTVKDSSAWQYRAAVRWGKTFGTSLNAYLKAALVSSGGSDGEIVINEITPKRADFGGVRTEFGIGATYAIGGRSQLWLDYEYAKADNYTKPWSFNAGYRILW